MNQELKNIKRVLKLSGHRPYYTADAARWLKLGLDRMTKGQDIFIPTKGTGLVASSLGMKIRQGFHYLVDKMDTPDQKYHRLYCEVEIVGARRFREGIMIKWKLGKIDYDGMLFEAIDSDTLTWKEALSDFIETSEDGDLFELAVAITPADIKMIREQIEPLGEFVVGPRMSEGFIQVVHSKLIKESAKR